MKIKEIVNDYKKLKEIKKKSREIKDYTSKILILSLAIIISLVYFYITNQEMTFYITILSLPIAIILSKITAKINNKMNNSKIEQLKEFGIDYSGRIISSDKYELEILNDLKNNLSNSSKSIFENINEIPTKTESLFIKSIVDLSLKKNLNLNELKELSDFVCKETLIGCDNKFNTYILILDLKMKYFNKENIEEEKNNILNEIDTVFRDNQKIKIIDKLENNMSKLIIKEETSSKEKDILKEKIKKLQKTSDIVSEKTEKIDIKNDVYVQKI